MTAPELPVRLPETMSAREIGAQMAVLRAQFGLSPQEAAERLHLRLRYVVAIEEGRFDDLPGQVFARGYIHNYAEFLGLDAEQVVRLCFSDNAFRKATASNPVMSSYASYASKVPLGKPKPWRSYSAGAVAVLLVLLLAGQLLSRSESPASESSTVNPVPETMLAAVRNMLMPTPGNKDCLLTDDGMLTCFYADETNRMLDAFNRAPFLLAGEIDVSQVELVPLPETPEIDDVIITPAETAPEEMAPAADAALATSND